jgi:hypothetical protein
VREGETEAEEKRGCLVCTCSKKKDCRRAGKKKTGDRRGGIKRERERERHEREGEREVALLHVQAEEVRLATGEEACPGHCTHMVAPVEFEYLPAAQGLHSALAFESVCV